MRWTASHQRVSAIALVAGGLLAWCCAGSTASAAANITVVDHDLQATIVPVVTRYLQQLHQLERDNDPNPTVTMRDVSPENRHVCLDLAKDALSLYPDHLVNAFVQTLALAEEITVWGTLVGGVQGPQVIGLTCMASQRHIVRKAVHGMMAGKVLDLSPPDWTEWGRGNPQSFRYGSKLPLKDTLAGPDAVRADRSLNASGFVGPIGLIVAQADFQTFAEQSFLDGPAFAATVRANPAMQGKLRLMLQSYLAVAPDLRPYFERTGLMAAAGDATH